MNFDQCDRVQGGNIFDTLKFLLYDRVPLSFQNCWDWDSPKVVETNIFKKMFSLFCLKKIVERKIFQVKDFSRLKISNKRVFDNVCPVWVP